MCAGQSDISALNSIAGDAFRFFNSGGNGAGCFLHIDHHSLANASGGGNSNTDNAQTAYLVNFTDQRANLGSTDIYADDGALHALPPPT